jgi:hypothetical protein
MKRERRQPPAHELESISSRRAMVRKVSAADIPAARKPPIQAVRREGLLFFTLKCKHLFPVPAGGACLTG